MRDNEAAQIIQACCSLFRKPVTFSSIGLYLLIDQQLFIKVLLSLSLIKISAEIFTFWKDFNEISFS